MKKLILSFVLLISIGITAQTNYQYAESFDNITNPERGMYKHTETHSTGYSLLDQSMLNGYRSSGYTLIMRVFYLENFRNGNISSTYLNNMQTDFNRIRTAGMKCIVRFAYSDGDTSGSADANKAQILTHIQQLKSTLILNKDVVLCYQAGFIGRWGEWYDSTNFGVENLTVQQLANRQEILYSILNDIALPSGRQVQVRTPKIKINIFGNVTTTPTTAYTSLLSSMVGHHNDCFVASSDDEGTYVNVNIEYPYLQQDTRYTVMGGETCSPNTTYANCVNVMDKIDMFSWDYLNSDYHPQVISDLQSQGCLNEIKNTLGYRFVLENATVTPNLITVNLKNVGVGHLFNRRPVYFVYRSTTTGAEFPFLVNTDARMWLKGSTISINQVIPALPIGQYDVFLNMPDEYLQNNPNYSIQLANSLMWESSTGYNNLKIQVNNGALNLIGFNFITGNINIDGDYKMYDLSGKLLDIKREGDVLITDHLPRGIYFLRVNNIVHKIIKK